MATIFRRGEARCYREARRRLQPCGTVRAADESQNRMLTSERDLTAGVQRVALARRPGRAEAEVDSSSLSVDRPPALCFLKLKRITGGRACMQGQLETAQGRGHREQPQSPRRRNGQVGGVWAGGKCAGVGGGGGHQPVQRYANTAAGHRKLVETLTRGGKRVRVVLEGTGIYGLDAALALSRAEGIEVMVANPRSVRDFAKALMQRSKNDPLDAVVLGEYGKRMPFERGVGPVKTVWSCGPLRGASKR